MKNLVIILASNLVLLLSRSQLILNYIKKAETLM